MDSRPTVLMVLAASSDKRVDQLVRGGRVNVGGKAKSLPELSVKDAKHLKVCAHRKRKKPMALDAHRDLAVLSQRLVAWAFDAEPIISKLDKQQKKLTLIVVKEAIRCLADVSAQLR